MFFGFLLQLIVTDKAWCNKYIEERNKVKKIRETCKVEKK
jgi:hypothetical protein